MTRKGQAALEYLLVVVLNLLIVTIAICLMLKNPSNATHVANSTMQAYDQLLNQSLQAVQNYLNATP